MNELGLVRSMWRIRAFEERVGQLTRANEVHGLVHLSTGQEAVAVGVCSQLRDDDVVYSGTPRPWARAGEGRADAGRDGGADGPRHRPLPRARWVDAPGRPRARVPRRDGRGRRQRPARARLGARRATLRVGRGRRRLLRRRRRPGRDLRRVGEHRRPLAAAGDPRLREQRLRRVHAAVGAHGGRAGQRRGRALRLPTRDRRRQRPARGARGIRTVPGESARGRGPLPARMPDPPARRPLRRRPAALPGADRRRRVARDRPDSQARRRPRASRRRRAPRSRTRSSSRGPLRFRRPT